MNQEQIKQMLLALEETQLEFSLIFSGKKSKKVNGLYKPETHEIILHNKNFATDNELIYTAIHEYTHHLIHEQYLQTHNGLSKTKKMRIHTPHFWARFHELLEKAETQGIYAIPLETSPELVELTTTIKTEYLEKHGTLMQEFGRLLIKAQELCTAANIRYEDYIDRVLKLPRQSAKKISVISNLNINPKIGFENMQIVAKLKDDNERKKAEHAFLAGKTPDRVADAFQKTMPEQDPKITLSKEKKRIENAITTLTKRLEEIEENLAQL